MPIRVHLPDGRIVNFPDGMDQAAIAAEVEKMSAPPQAETPAEPTTADNIRSALQWGGNVLSGMMGMGQAGRNAVENPTATLASAVVPPVIGKALTTLGKGAYRGGVALLPRTLKQANPEIAKRGFKEGIALTKRGAAKAEQLVGQSRQQADDLIAAAEQAGAPRVSTAEVVRELRPVRARLRNQAALGAKDETPALAQRAKEFAQRNKYFTRNPDEASSFPFVKRTGMKLTKAQELKREAQDLATTAYKARDRGAVINQTEALTNEAQARGLRKAIEARVPAVGPVNQRTQELLGVMRGAEHAGETGHILSRLGGAGVAGGAALGAGALPALGAAGAGAMLTTPGGLTSLGVGMKGLGTYLPGSLRNALLALLASQERPEDEHDRGAQ